MWFDVNIYILEISISKGRSIKRSLSLEGKDYIYFQRLTDKIECNQLKK